MVSYAVVGASRGIGLEYVRQLATRPDTTVFAIVRNAHTSTHLSAAIADLKLKNVHILEADVADHATLRAAAKALSDTTGGQLDCLIHNAGRMDGRVLMLGYDDFASMDALDEEFLTAFKVNALGPIHSITAFLPLLRASTVSIKKIVVISRSAGLPKFVTVNNISNMAAYGMTKSAGIMATTKWALKLKDEGFIVVSLNPSLVDTSGTTGTTDAAMDPEMIANFSSANNLIMQTPTQSVEAQLKVVDNLTPAENGLLLSHLGGEFQVRVPKP